MLLSLSIIRFTIFQLLFNIAIMVFSCFSQKKLTMHATPHNKREKIDNFKTTFVLRLT